MAEPSQQRRDNESASNVARHPAADREAPVAAPATAPAATPDPDARRRRLRLVLFALLPVFLLVGGYVYATGGATMSTENAYVRADILPVSTDVSGIVKNVAVRDNQQVAAGDVLFTLDDKPFRIALDKANADLGLVAAQLKALKASYQDMQAQIAQAEVDVDFYAKGLKRQQALAARDVSSQAAFDQATRDLEGAQQKVRSLKEQLAGIVANLAGDPQIDVTRHPRYLAALATRDEAARQLAHTIVKAPMAGIVTNVPSLQPGQYLAASTAAFSLVATDHVWIEANPKETQLTYVKPGQPATISVDTYPDVTWQGTVESISPASAASFSLLPAQNTSGNWVKVVQRIAMRVRIDTPAGKPPLRAGMSVIVDVNTGHARGLPFFSSSSERHG